MSDTDMESNHTRNTSQETGSSIRTGSSSGASYRLILEHVLSYPGTYEIPLRHMYSINCAQATRSASQSASPATSPVDGQFPSAADMTAANTQLTTALLAQISQLPSQPASLPPSFITTFVRRCFTPDVQWIDFPQALTALDYLKDLEARRRKEVADLKSRLGVNVDTAAADIEAMNGPHPGAAEFLREMDNKDKRADSLYTQLFISLRRWILINEMSLMPFNKHNSIAMLNTLYPPVVNASPTSKLQPETLSKQREGYFRYVTAVEKKGTGVLMNLQMQGAEAGEDNGWPAVHRTLSKYLYLAGSMIAECHDVPSVAHFPASAPRGPLPQLPPQASGKATPASTENIHRKVDSGVGLDGQPQSPATVEPPKVSLSRSPSAARTLPPKTPATPKRSGLSTLERIARELRIFGKSKPEIEEIYIPPPPPPKTPSKVKESKMPKTLRKMRSAGALSELNHGNASNSNFNASTVSGRLSSKKSMLFDKRTMRGDRLAYEERAGISQSKLGYDQLL